MGVAITPTGNSVIHEYVGHLARVDRAQRDRPDDLMARGNFGGAYTTEALAIAGKPAVPAGDTDMGYFTVQAASPGWTTGTDALFGGTSGTPALASNYYSGVPPVWNAFGRPTQYQGSLFFIVNTFATVASRTTIIWCEPNQPFLGYLQTGYADYWNLIQTGADALYALQGTNIGLFYFRDTSIGLAAGTPSLNFATTATNDAIAGLVGTVAPDSVQYYLSNIFFTDIYGRPWMLPIGSDPVPIHQQMRAQWVAQPSINFPSYISYTCTSAIWPAFNLYVVAIWGANFSALTSPVTMYAFDANSGTYMGRWQIGAGMTINSLGQTLDQNGHLQLAVLGSKVSGSSGNGGGYLWLLSDITGSTWQDNGVVPSTIAQTARLGYQPKTVWNADLATAITMSADTVNLTVTTPYLSATAEGTGAPGASQDQTFRCVFGVRCVSGTRDAAFTLAPRVPRTPNGSCNPSVSEATALAAGPEDLQRHPLSRQRWGGTRHGTRRTPTPVATR